MGYNYDLREVLEQTGHLIKEEIDIIVDLSEEELEPLHWCIEEEIMKYGSWRAAADSSALHDLLDLQYSAYLEELEDEYEYTTYFVSEKEVTVDGEEYPICTFDAEETEAVFYDEKLGEMVTKTYSDYVHSHVMYLCEYYAKAKLLQELVEANTLDKYLTNFSERTEGLDDKIRSLADKMAEKDADIQKCKENGKLDEAKGLYNNILHSAREIIYNEYIYC